MYSYQLSPGGEGEVRAGLQPRMLAACNRVKIFIELMTSDHKLKASRGGSKRRIYGT